MWHSSEDSIKPESMNRKHLICSAMVTFKNKPLIAARILLEKSPENKLKLHP